MVPLSSQLLTNQARYRRCIYLAIVLVPIAISCLQRYLQNWGFRIPLPGCPLRHFTGIPCPGWGMTRAFEMLMQGHWQQAIAYHLFAPIVFGGFVIAGVHLLLEVIRGQKLHAIYLPWVCNPRVQILAFLILVGYHATRLQALAASGELLVAFTRSPLYCLLFS